MFFFIIGMIHISMCQNLIKFLILCLWTETSTSALRRGPLQLLITIGEHKENNKAIKTFVLNLPECNGS